MSGSLAEPAEQIIQNLLVELGHGTLPSAAGSWPVNVGQNTEDPDSQITVIGTASRKNGRLMINGETQEHYGIQILVRAARHGTAWTKMDAIANGLDSVALDTVAIGSNRYLVHAITRESGPFGLGKEEGTSRQLFSLNVTTAINQTV